MIALVKNAFQKLFNGRGAREAVFAPTPQARKVISCDEAVEVFDKLARMRNIPYAYTQDGCYARAHLMCRKLLAMDVVPEKAWVFETKERELTVDYPNGEQRKWWFHVAPVVHVDIPESGPTPVVLDPSMFDGPVGLRQWSEKMNADISQVSVLPCGQAPENCKGDYTPYDRTTLFTDQRAEKELRDYAKLLEGKTHVVFMSAFRRKWGRAENQQEGAAPCPDLKV